MDNMKKSSGKSSTQNDISEIARSADLFESQIAQKDYADPYSSEYKIEKNNISGKIIHKTSHKDDDDFMKKLHEYHIIPKKKTTIPKKNLEK